MRIAQVANFYGPSSGGLRTTIHALADGYHRAGHESVVIVPGSSYCVEQVEWGQLIKVPSWSVPGSGGYQVITDVDLVCTILDEVAPDRLEVADRLTLRSLGWWARERNLPAVMWAHERVDGVIKAFLPFLPARLLADIWNSSTAVRFDAVVTTTEFAAQEFDRVNSPPVVRVPLGTDLENFRPSRATEIDRRSLMCADEDVLLVTCTRLSKEKEPGLAVDCLRTLVGRGVRARLAILGSGPLEKQLRKAARDLPVTFLGYVSDRAQLARTLAAADVALSPGPIETFGLAALEALACGTPVVASRTSALAEIVTGAAGQAVPPDAGSFADAVLAQLARPEEGRRRAARQRAEEFPWSNTVRAMLALHGLALPAKESSTATSPDEF